MNSTQLNCFLAVADSLNFARASEKLHITQPAVTHQINSLESELDVKLFKRTTRTVELTREGFSFIADAKSILNTMSMAKMRFAAAEKTEPAPFFIGCGLKELVFLPDLVKSMLDLYPNIHPFIKTIPFPALMNHLRNESIDVLFGLQGVTAIKQDCRFHELTKAPIVCAMPKDHPLASKAKITRNDLPEQRIAVLDTANIIPQVLSLQSHLLSGHRSADLYCCETTEEILILVKAGMGITFLPDIIPMREAALAYVPLEAGSSVSYGIFYKTLQDHAMIRDFLKVAAAYFQSFAPGDGFA